MATCVLSLDWLGSYLCWKHTYGIWPAYSIARSWLLAKVRWQNDEHERKSGNVTWPCFLKAFAFLINEQKIYCSWINTLLWDCYILIPESLVTSINLNADEIDDALCFYYLSFLPPKTKFQSATMCCSFHVRTQQLILVAYQARGDCLFGCLTSYNAMF